MQNRDIRSLLTDHADDTLREISRDYPVPFDQEKLFQRSYVKFQGTAEPPGVRRLIRRRKALRMTAAAACLLLSVGLGAGIWARQQRIETYPPQEPPATYTQTVTTTAAAVPSVTEAQTTAGCTETRPHPAETTVTSAATVSPAQSTMLTKEPTACQPVQTAAAAVMTTLPAVQTAAVSMPQNTQSPPIRAEYTFTDPPRTAASSQTARMPATTMTATLPTVAYPYDKEELWMKANNLRRMQAIINAAVSAAALSTTPVLTTTAAAAQTTAAATTAGTAVTELTAPPTEIPTQYGDVNLDQSISLTDLVHLQRYLLGTGKGLGNWANADLYPDGVIDIFDLAVLKRELIGQSDAVGGTLSVNVVDMMSEKPLDTAIVMLVGLNENFAYPLVEWVFDPAQAQEYVISGLPTDSSYSYMLELRDLPQGYGSPIGNWNQQYMFSYNPGETNKDVTLRVAANDAEPNVKIHTRDWGVRGDIPYCTYGLMCITDKNGTPYYPTQMFEDVALPDGDYHVFMCPFEDYPVQMLTPESEFAKEIHRVFPDVEITDKSKGLDFTVKDGKADRELVFDFGPLDGKTNHLTVNCFDSMTGKPLEGVTFSLTAKIGTDEDHPIASWVSDATGTKTFDDLVFAGLPAYTVHVDQVPEGYTGGFDQDVYWGYVNDYSTELDFSFIPVTADKNFTAEIRKWEDQSLINDAATYEIWSIEDGDRTYQDSQNLPNHTKVLERVKAGEQVALKDGDYFAVLDPKQFK